MFHFMMYNDPIATPAAEAGPSAGPSAAPSTSPTFGLAVSIYTPGLAPPGSASAPNIAPASASFTRRKCKHPRISTITTYSISLLYNSETPMPWQFPSSL